MMFGDQIKEWVKKFDVAELIARFDVDFDAPLEHEYAIGVLRMRGAFQAVPDATDRDLAVRVGAHWCAIVRADVEYDLLEGLRLAEASRGDAETLRGRLLEGHSTDEFIAYVVARWFDGVGKIRYRLGSYSRARMSFETAIAVAKRAGLAQCLPDLRSNFFRARFEEAKQSGTESVTQSLRDHIAELDAELDATSAAETTALAELAAADTADPPVRARELLRSRSSLLHNRAVALKEQGEEQRSMADSLRSLKVSERLGDKYRIGQSQNHQALLDPARASELFRELRVGAWRRGRLIAWQRMALTRPAAEGAAEIKQLLAQLERDSAATGGAGLDIEMYAFTVRMFERIVAGMTETGADAEVLRRQLAEERMKLATSVRSAVALPAYKRAYNKAVRPAYLEEIQEQVAGAGDRRSWEHAFGLAEESNARELLDMLASANLPQIEPPPRASTPARPAEEAIDDQLHKTRKARRALLTRRDGTDDAEQDEELRKDLGRRESEFEEQFLRQPLEAVPPDPEIAHRVRMFIVNHPGTCVVRYVSYGTRAAGGGRIEPAETGAFVFRDHSMTFRRLGAYQDVADLARSLPLEHAPSGEQSGRIWSLLVAPLWDLIAGGSQLRHLVVIPTDAIFAVPMHVACEPGSTLPLAARIPFSQSVSATAFVDRARHLLKRQPVDEDDDLAAIVIADGRVTGMEIVDTGWDTRHMIVAGNPPPRVGEVRKVPADLRGLAEISAVRPEFFVYAGHGNIHPAFPDLGPYLQLHGAERLTQYDVALRLRLPRNKLTVLGACLAGQGAQTPGGDVVGFLRSLIAAGAGAVAVPLWSVWDDAIVATVNDLLIASRAAVHTPDRVFDVVDTLHRQYAALAADHTDRTTIHELFEQMPIGLYT